MRIVVALGGNALVRRGEPPDEGAQTRRLSVVAPAIARLAATNDVVIVHGNGPQVGLLASENVVDPAVTTPYPLGDMVAESQGLIGLWLQQALRNAGARKPAVTVVTQTVVDEADEAWRTPTKFIGPGYSRAAADALAVRHAWTFSDDGNRSRRVVPSPEPRRIIEEGVIRDLLHLGAIVVAGGGGGVPVVESAAGLRTVDAVVDKDGVAAVLAIALGADILVILTDVSNVQLGFGTDHAAPVFHTTDALLDHRDFAEGSMGPKVKAATLFTRVTGKRSAIGSLDDLEAVVDGRSGTQVEASAGAIPRPIG